MIEVKIPDTFEYTFDSSDSSFEIQRWLVEHIGKGCHYTVILTYGLQDFTWSYYFVNKGIMFLFDNKSDAIRFKLTFG